jgi:hypothetical protein
MEMFNIIFEDFLAQPIALQIGRQQGVTQSQLRTYLDTKHQELDLRTRRSIAC